MQSVPRGEKNAGIDTHIGALQGDTDGDSGGTAANDVVTNPRRTSNRVTI